MDKPKSENKVGKLHVKVFSPYQVFFEGSANSLTASNKDGPFDVLYGHSNFFSLLEAGKAVVVTEFETISIELRSGILRVRDNAVTLFANV